jgi:Ca-activated chloride channel homolog
MINSCKRLEMNRHPQHLYDCVCDLKITKLRLLCAIVMLFFCATKGMPQPEQKKAEEAFRFSVQSQLVEVYFTVTKGNQLVPNLIASDFVLTEDDMTVSVDRLDNQDVPLHIVLLVDLSESIRESLKTIQDAAIAFIDSLKPQDRVMLILFNSEIHSFEQTTDDRQPIIGQIRNARARGMTKLYDSLLVGMNYLDGKPGRKAIVCFTDGQDTSETSSGSAVLSAAKRFGYPIYMIGAGAGLELSSLKIILQEFADTNSGKAFFIQSVHKLRDAFAKVAEELRSAYSLYYYTRVPPDGRWHDLTISTTDPEYAVHSRKGFLARRANPER